MNETGIGVPPDILIDSSHKHTYVCAKPYIGPGNAHHRYYVVSKDKNEKLLEVSFQDGPILEAGVNGAMDENLITIVIDRLRGFQSGKYCTRENAIALTKLEESLMWLKERTRNREMRNVEGTHKI